MAVYLQVTGHVVGQMLMYEKIRRQGQSKLVPTYRLVLSGDRLPDEYFEVTRDTSDVIFGDGVYHYDTNGECPPSRLCSPYRAIWHGYGGLKDALRLFEPGASDDPDFAMSTVRGVSRTLRRGILMHIGPARSEGCFTLAGGQGGYDRFRRMVELYLMSEKVEELIVHVLPRHFGADNPLSVQ